MFNKLMQWVSAEKGQLVGTIHGRVPIEAIRELERFIRARNISGVLEMLNDKQAKFVLEGPKARLEQLLHEFPQLKIMSGQILKISWGQYTGKHTALRVSLR